MVAYVEVAPDSAMDAPRADAHVALPEPQNSLQSQAHAADETRHEPLPGNFKRIRRSPLKPLIFVATAQYVIVTVLAGLAAWMVASEASKAINAKLETLITALKRF